MQDQSLSVQPDFGDFTPDWISSKLSAIDQGVIEIMDQTNFQGGGPGLLNEASQGTFSSTPVLRHAARAASELTLAMDKLGFRKAWRLAARLEYTFQHPAGSTDFTERLIVDTITLRCELPCSPFMK